MQSSTCMQRIRPFGKRDEAMYKSATTLLAKHNISLQMGGDHIRNVVSGVGFDVGFASVFNGLNLTQR